MADWQVGDLALCVNDRYFHRQRGILNVPAARGLVAGKTYLVTGVQGTGVGPDGPTAILHCAGIRSSGFLGGGPGAWRFVKVLPPAADEFDRETIALMNGAKEPAL